jgi:hypothetical protein
MRVGAAASVLVVEEDKLRFGHQLMQESLAAKELMQRDVSELVRPIYFHGGGATRRMATERQVTKWDQVVLAAVHLVDDWDGWIVDIASRDPYLAVTCLEHGKALQIPAAARVVLTFATVMEALRRDVEHLDEYVAGYPINSRGYDEGEARQDAMLEAIDMTQEKMRQFGRAYSGDFETLAREGDETNAELAKLANTWLSLDLVSQRYGRQWVVVELPGVFVK